MSTSLDDRLTALEKEVAKLMAPNNGAGKDWRSTIGMFAGDEVMKKIDDEARKYREADRRRARRRRRAKQVKR